MRPLAALLRREFFERVRTVGHFGMRTAYVGLLFFVIVVVAWDSFMTGLNQPISHSPDLGQVLFRTFAFVQYGLVVLLVPLIGAGAIVDERAEGSLQLLLLTHLSYGQIAFGKFASRLGLIALVVSSNVPVLFFAALLGGVEPMDVVRVFTLTMATAAMFLGVSMSASSLASQSPVGAATATYTLLVLMLVSLFFLFLVDPSWFYFWHGPLALTFAVVEPLTIGASWWIAAAVNFGLGGLGVVASALLLRRGVRGSRSLSQRRDGAAIVPTASRAAGVWGNPVAWREWVRKGRPWHQLGACAALGIVSGVVLGVTTNESEAAEIFLIGLNFVFFTACIFSLAIGSSVFAQEKREQTLDLLKLTYMSPWEIVSGKLSAVWRLALCFSAWVLPAGLAAGLMDEDLPLLGAVGSCVAMVVGLTFVGAVGVFYSLVAESPMRAAFPSVSTFIYVSTFMFMWPMVFFQDEDAIPFCLLIGWSLVFVPPLLIVVRTAPRRLLPGGVMLGVWAAMVLVLGLSAKESLVLFGVSPFVLLNASVLLFTENSGSDMAGTLVLGGVLLVWATVFFIWASMALLDEVSTPETVESGDPALAALLSGVIPGAGQVYLGEMGRGAVIMVVSMLLGCGLGLANVAASVDAYKLATRAREVRRATESRR